MNLVCEFRYNTDAVLTEELRTFIDSLDEAAIEQYPGWYAVRKDPGTLCYFVARHNGHVVCCAQILEYRSRFIQQAILPFGPAFADIEALVESVKSIHRYFRERGFSYLAIQLAMPTGAAADYVEYSLNREFNIVYHFDASNWSSLLIDLNNSMENIFDGFADNHKGSIKKARKLGLTTRRATSADEVRQLSVLYDAMRTSRGFSTERDDTEQFYTRLFRFFRETGRGFFLLTIDPAGEIVGGLAIVKQGKTARYFLGASDPAKRELPILHLAILEALRAAQEMHCTAFDFWGYNHFALESDQVFHINRFKKWFSGTYCFYPKRMHFYMRPVRYRVYRTLKSLQGRLRGSAG
jgi:hypothetical protein